MTYPLDPALFSDAMKLDPTRAGFGRGRLDLQVLNRDLTQDASILVATDGYGRPSKHEANVRRRESPGLTRTPQSSVAFTPLQNLFGIITPSGIFKPQELWRRLELALNAGV